MTYGAMIALGLGVTGYALAFSSGYYIGRAEGSRRARNIFQQQSDEVLPDRIPIAVDSKGNAILVALDQKG